MTFILSESFSSEYDYDQYLKTKIRFMTFPEYFIRNIQNFGDFRKLLQTIDQQKFKQLLIAQSQVVQSKFLQSLFQLQEIPSNVKHITSSQKPYIIRQNNDLLQLYDLNTNKILRTQSINSSSYFINSNELFVMFEQKIISLKNLQEYCYTQVDYIFESKQRIYFIKCNEPLSYVYKVMPFDLRKTTEIVTNFCLENQNSFLFTTKNTLYRIQQNTILEVSARKFIQLYQIDNSILALSDLNNMINMYSLENYSCNLKLISNIQSFNEYEIHIISQDLLLKVITLGKNEYENQLIDSQNKILYSIKTKGQIKRIQQNKFYNVFFEDEKQLLNYILIYKNKIYSFKSKWASSKSGQIQVINNQIYGRQCKQNIYSLAYLMEEIQEIEEILQQWQ
ncbi:Hypothetical_protein [Hexamita inflata]|uniref:Hypothetical_protein n=1 Tax=Hexamita inflata TaxID=28002 RepID=A0AA86Q3W0_9EUKA|nr:Hypothetical protein HINF_LOCUS39186 [Hexamita inflata]